MNRYIKPFRHAAGLALLSLMALAACTTDTTVPAESGTNGQTPQEGTYEVKFAVNMGQRASRRATTNGANDATVTAETRENTIAKMYAVTFYPDETNNLQPGKFYKAFQVQGLTDTSTGRDNSEYTFNFKMEKGGLFYMYLVANPGTTLEGHLTNGGGSDLVSGTSTCATFEGLLEEDSDPISTDDPYNQANITNFLMTSKPVQVDIKGTAATDLTANPIELTRAAVRIDIDCSALGSDFVLTQVVFKNRKKQTVLFSDAIPAATPTQDDTKTYTKPALLADFITANTWKAGIYAYENLKTATQEQAASETVGSTLTTVTVIGTLKGIAVTHNVEFWSKTSTDPAPATYSTIQLRRNHLYEIKLTKKDVPDQYAQLSHSISVVDWTTGTEVEWAGDNLAQKNTPEILEVKKYIWDDGESDYGDAVTVNTSEISTNNLMASVGNKKMKLTIKVKAGSTGANIKCPALGNLGEITNVSTPEKDYDADGNILQTWTVTLVANASKTAAKTNYDPIVFNIYNQLDATAATTLKLNPIEMQQNALWWVAEYNLSTIKGAKDGANNVASASSTTFMTTHSIYAQGSNSTYANTFNFTDAGLTATGGTGVMDGYHLPTFDEQISIVPMNNPSTGSDGTNIFGIGNTDPASPYSFVEQPCNIGGNTVNAGTGTSYMYKVSTGNEVYAVRFIGTDYASAWHYKWDSSPCNGLLIESYLVDVADAAAAQTLLLTLATSFTALESGTYNGSSTKANLRPTDTDATDEGYCQRFLPACGYCNGATGTATNFQGSLGFYWSATAKDSSYGWHWDFGSGNLSEYTRSRTYGLSVRLFRDH